MKITKLILENFANIYSATNKKRIEIDFSKCKNNIVIFLGPNGSGKTSILSELHPFATSGSMDIRSDINLILDDHNGYKEIHIEDEGDVYIIRHHYLFKKKTKVIKSFFECNGEELNENGNVSSFKTMVNMHLGLEPELMRLMRLGSNVNGLIDMKASNRKAYASRLFQDIDIYSSLYKKVSDKYRVTRNLIKSVADKIDRLKIYDANALEDENKTKKELIKSYQENKNNLIGEIMIIESLIKGLLDSNNINSMDSLLEEYNECGREIKSLKKKMNESKIPVVLTYPVEKTINEYNNMIVRYESEININKVKVEYNFSLLDTIISDNLDLEKQIDSFSSNERINELCDLLDNLKDKLARFNDVKEIKESKQDWLYLLSTLQNLDHIIGNLDAYPHSSIKDTIKLMMEGKSVEQFVNGNRKLIQKEIDDYKVEIANVNKESTFMPIVMYQLCDTNECPYKDFYNKCMNSKGGNVQKMMKKIESLEVMDETLESYLQIKSVLVSVNKFLNMNEKYFKLIPKFNFEYVLACIMHRKPRYNEDTITNRIADIEEYEEYIETKKRIDEVEKELDLVSRVEVDINKLNKKLIENNIKKDKLEKEINDLNVKIKSLVEKVEFYNELIECIHEMVDTLNKIKESEGRREEVKNRYNELNKIKILIKDKEKEKQYKEQLLDRVNFQIDELSKQIEENNFKLRDYYNFIEEKNKLEAEYEDIDVLRMALSPNTGLPVLFLQIYLNRCIMTINQLLGIAYDDLEINDFIINDKEFRIPYMKKGLVVPDITYASQGERSFLSLALSLALIIQTLDKYNIMLLDEVDATLDTKNRRHFIDILEKLISRTNSEQIFMITHNNMFDNYPVDVIMTGDVDIDNFKNINIVWKA